MHPYQWILAYAVARAQNAPADPPNYEPTRVEAWAGQLSQPASNAANDLVARVLILMWFWWWCRAKSYAKTRDPSGFSFKTVANDQWPEITPQPLPHLASPAFSRPFPPCQIDHLPTD